MDFFLEPFDKSFGNHNVNVIAVAEKQDAKSEGISASGQRPDNNIQVLQGISNPNGSSSLSQNSLISYVGRLTYDYAGKYLLGASIRRDGSSKFAPGRKWGIFPSASVGWRISEEPFMTVPFISSMKLRAGYGVLGNDGAIGQFVYQASYGSQNITGLPDGTRVRTYGLNARLPNDQIKWEEVKTFEDICSICYAHFNDLSFVLTLPECKHTFHFNCIMMWVKNKPNCPCCRMNLLTYYEEQRKR